MKLMNKLHFETYLVRFDQLQWTHFKTHLIQIMKNVEEYINIIDQKYV